MIDTDLREKLFLEFKEVHNKKENIADQIRAQQTELEKLHDDMCKTDKEYQFLRRVINVVIIDSIDPILAKFKVSEMLKDELTDSYVKTSISGYNDFSISEVKKSKIRRMFNAIKEIWYDR